MIQQNVTLSQGIALGKEQSAFPHLWDGLVIWSSPEVGPQGDKLFDWSRNGRNGSLVNMDAATDYVGGLYGYALNYDGSDDYLDFGNVPEIDNAAQDLSFAVAIRAGAGQTNHAIFMYDTNDALSPGIDIYCMFKTNLTIGGIGDGGEWNTGYPSSSILDSQWHVIVIALVGAALNVYVDGRIVASQASAHNHANYGATHNLRVCDDSNVNRITADVGFFGVWRRGITQTEAAELWAGASPLQYATTIPENSAAVAGAPATEEQLTPSLEWESYATPRKTPTLDWEAVTGARLTPSLEWNATIDNRFVPNIVHYPLYFPEPTDTDTSIVPLSFSGCFPGFSLYMKDTGSSGNTVVEVYVNGDLINTVTVPADNNPFTQIYYSVMNSMLSPLDELEVRVTDVATGAEDLKVDLYEMTFPFEIAPIGFANIQNDIPFSGVNKEYLFQSADYWFIETNQPMKDVESLIIIDSSGVAHSIDPDDFTLESGTFYNNRIKFEPFTESPIDHIRIKVQDWYNTWYIFDLKPVISANMSDLPTVAAERIETQEVGTTDVTGSGTASASATGGSNAPSRAVNNIANNTSFWATDPNQGFPVSWAYDFGSGNEKIITKISIKPFDNENGQYFKDFYISGSNVASPSLTNEAHWTSLHLARAPNNHEAQVFVDYEFYNDTAYRHYRIKNTNNYRSFTDTGIDELEMFEMETTYTSASTFRSFIAATQYRYSFDNGSTWEDWTNVSIDNKITIDFAGQDSGTYNMKIQYQYGNNILEESFVVLYGTGPLNASVLWLGNDIQINYSDDIPFDRVDVFYDDEFAKTSAPSIYSGLEEATTLNEEGGVASITVDAGSIYYNGNKYDFDGSEYIVVPDFTNNRLMFKVLFGFNFTTLEFEFREQENNDPGQIPAQDVENFYILHAFEYGVVTQDNTFTDYDITFNSQWAFTSPALVPIEIVQDRIYDIYVYDKAGRYYRAHQEYTKTIFNIWRTLTVSTPRLRASATDTTNIAQNAGDNDAAFWGSPTGGSLPVWLRYDFGQSDKKIIVEYTLRSNFATSAGRPTAWKLQGSNDGGTWTDLHTVTGESWASDVTKTYSVSNSTAYAYYRLNFTGSGGGAYVQVREWELKIVAAGADLIDHTAVVTLLPGEIHQFEVLDFDIESEDWEDPL